MKVIVKYADGWNMMRVSNVDDYKYNMKRLRRTCKKTGRDPDEIRTSIAISGTIEECEKKLERFEEEGLDLAILRLPRGQEIEYLHHFRSY